MGWVGLGWVDGLLAGGGVTKMAAEDLIVVRGG